MSAKFCLLYNGVHIMHSGPQHEFPGIGLFTYWPTTMYEVTVMYHTLSYSWKQPWKVFSEEWLQHIINIITSIHFGLPVNILKTCLDSGAHASPYHEVWSTIISLDEFKFINDLFSILHIANSLMTTAATKIEHCSIYCHTFFFIFH